MSGLLLCDSATGHLLRDSVTGHLMFYSVLDEFDMYCWYEFASSETNFGKGSFTYTKAPEYYDNVGWGNWDFGTAESTISLLIFDSPVTELLGEIEYENVEQEVVFAMDVGVFVGLMFTGDSNPHWYTDAGDPITPTVGTWTFDVDNKPIVDFEDDGSKAKWNPQPMCAIEDATDLADTTATLNGKLNPFGKASTYHFEYGETTGYGTSTDETSAGSGTETVDVSAAITELTEGTEYHCKLVVTNEDGSIESEDKTFTTTEPKNFTISCDLPVRQGYPNACFLDEDPVTFTLSITGATSGTVVFNANAAWLAAFSITVDGVSLGNDDTCVISGTASVVISCTDYGYEGLCYFGSVDSDTPSSMTVLVNQMFF